MSRLETAVHQPFPDERQLLETRTEEVDALAARDLGVEPEVARDLDKDEESEK